MLYTPLELAGQLGQRVRHRRVAMNLTQVQAAEWAGVSYRTWRRLEAEGKASIEDLVRAAIALRCEGELAALFPEPVATSMDALLSQQKQKASARRRASPRRLSS